MKLFALIVFALAALFTKAQSMDSVKPPLIYQVVEVMPKFRGGEDSLMRFIASHIKYPQYERDNKIEGRVVVGFVVNETGEITELQVKKGVSAGIDAEALRVCRLFPKFIPGMQRGKNVRVAYVLPIMFRLRK